MQVHQTGPLSVSGEQLAESWLTGIGNVLPEGGVSGVKVIVVSFGFRCFEF